MKNQLYDTQKHLKYKNIEKSEVKKVKKTYHH